MRLRRRHLAALLATGGIAAFVSCSSLDDTAWLAVTSFRDSDQNVISVLSSSLSDEETDEVDVGLTNFTRPAGGTGAGVDIFVSRVDVTYGYPGRSLPSYTYGVSAYIPAGSSDSSGSTPGTETFIQDLPLVPVALKDLVTDISGSAFIVQATVTVRGETTEGKKVTAVGRLPINFAGGKGGGSTETVSAPTFVTASKNNPAVNETISFNTGGATVTPAGGTHIIQYRFAFGDGTTASSWSATPTATHKYTTSEGSPFTVRAQAKCSTHNVESSWSTANAIISVNP